MSNFLFHVDPPAVADAGKELEIQSRFRNRLRKIAPAIKLFAIPNGSNITGWERIQKHREGLVRGFPDLGAMAHPGLIAFCEFKTKTGQLSDDQIRELNWLHKSGFPCGVFRSAETAIQALRDWGFPFADTQQEAA